MLIRTSKWSVLYYFFNNLWRQFLSIIIITSTLMSGFSNTALVLLIIWFVVIRIVKGIVLSKAVTVYVEPDSIVVNKSILSVQQTKILKSDIQSIKIKESFIGRLLHVADLDISIKENVLEKQDIKIRCITRNAMETILDSVERKSKEEYDESAKEWNISKKQILLSATMSLSWSYIVSLAYLREDLREISDFPIFKIIFEIFEKIFEQKYELLAYFEIIIGGILLAIIANAFKYNKYKITIKDDTMNISRGFFDSYKSSIKLNEISSISIKESIFSRMIGGYGKLMAEGKVDEEDTLSLTIFPFEKKTNIKFYLENWFHLHFQQMYRISKRKLMKLVESILIVCLLVILCIFIYELMPIKYAVLCIVLCSGLAVNIMIKIWFSYISVDKKSLVVYKAGIKSRTIYVKNSEIACIDKKSNFLQRLLKCSDIHLYYISCNNECDVVFRNYRDADIEKIISTWQCSQSVHREERD